MDAPSPNRTLTFRCSTIFVSEGNDTHVFRAIEEMPAPLRSRLQARTQTGISATIFIANRGGREELAKRLRGLPSRVSTRLEEVAPPARDESSTEPPRFAALTAESGLAPIVRHGLMLACGLGVLAWLVAAWK